MMESAACIDSEASSSDFIVLLRSARNGFMVSVNGHDFVVQVESHRPQEIEKALDLIERAYFQVRERK